MAVADIKLEEPFASVTTRVDEVADGIYRLATPIAPEFFPGGFTYAQFLIADEEPLLYHTGPHKMFPLLVDAMKSVVPIEDLRWLSFGHGEADENGAMLDVLEAAPNAEVVCGQMLSRLVVNDRAPRPAKVLQHRETMKIGQHEVMWLDTPHIPHNWEAGMLFETTTKTLMCGDLFTLFGNDHPPLTDQDILGPAEELRQRVPYFSNAAAAAPVIREIADLRPDFVAGMHAPVWQGDGRTLLLKLADALAAS
jgi:flavorubredoxin